MAQLTSALCLGGSYDDALELHQLILYATRKAFGTSLSIGISRAVKGQNGPS
jgi:hypothetical protein